MEQLDRRARGHVQVAQRVPLVEHLDDLDEPRVAQVLDGLARTGAELARQLGRAQLDPGLRGEALEEARAGGLRPRARQLADAPLGGRGRERQPDVALPIHLDQAVRDQRLHRRRAARDPSELVERDRLAPGVEERSQRPRAPRGAPTLDARGELARPLGVDREADDLGDARPAARASQLVAALGQPSADERAERGVEPARAHGGAQVVDLAGRVVQQRVEPLLALGERRRALGVPSHDAGARAFTRAGREHERVRLPRRREVVPGDPRGELQLRRVEPRRALDGREQLADVTGIAGQVGGRLDDHALQLALPERDVDDLAGLDRAAVRDAVGEGHERGPPGVDGHLHKARSGLDGRLGGHASMIRSVVLWAYYKTDVR